MLACICKTILLSFLGIFKRQFSIHIFIAYHHKQQTPLESIKVLISIMPVRSWGNNLRRDEGGEKLPPRLWSVVSPGKLCYRNLNYLLGLSILQRDVYDPRFSFLHAILKHFQSPWEELLTWLHKRNRVE